MRDGRQVCQGTGRDAGGDGAGGVRGVYGSLSWTTNAGGDGVQARGGGGSHGAESRDMGTSQHGAMMPAEDVVPPEPAQLASNHAGTVRVDCLASTPPSSSAQTHSSTKAQACNTANTEAMYTHRTSHAELVAGGVRMGSGGGGGRTCSLAANMPMLRDIARTMVGPAPRKRPPMPSSPTIRTNASPTPL